MRPENGRLEVQENAGLKWLRQVWLTTRIDHRRIEMTVRSDALEKHLLKNGTRPDDVKFFVDRFDRYPHLAQAPVTVKPPSVAGQHMSVRLVKGWRLWGFETEDDRNHFIRNHEGVWPFDEYYMNPVSYLPIEGAD